MYNGILINDNEHQTLLDILHYVLSLSDEQIIYLKNNAFETALELFSIKSNAKKLKNFLENL